MGVVGRSFCAAMVTIACLAVSASPASAADVEVSLGQAPGVTTRSDELIKINGPPTGVDLRLEPGPSGTSEVRVIPVSRVTIVQPVAPCARVVNTSAVSCPLLGRIQVRAVMGDGDDRVDATAITNLQVVLLGGGGDDVLLGGAVTQVPVTQPQRAQALTTLSGEGGNDVLRAAITGSARTDLSGGAGNDQLLGGPGVDQMDGGNGGDLLDGGAGGSDGVEYNRGAAGEPVTLTLGDGRCNDGGESDRTLTGTVAVPGCNANSTDRDRIINTESASGTFADDDITGGPTPGTLNGLPGNDHVEGGPAADTLQGGGGGDTVFARDAIADVLVECGRAIDGTSPRSLAVVDALDPVARCATIERGAPGSTGPVGVPTPIPPPVVIGQPTPTAETPPLVEATPVVPNVPSTEPPGATGAGGGDNGKTPPQLQIISPAATLDTTGRIALRVRCVYQAKACAGSVTVTARKAATARRKGKTVKLRKGQSLGASAVEIPWGKSLPTPVKLNKAAATFLKTSRKPLTVTVTVRARDSAFPTGAIATITANVLIAARR